MSTADCARAGAVGLVLLWLGVPLARGASPTPEPSRAAPVQTLIPWLLEEDAALRGIPFRDVILATTGRKIIPFKADDPVDQRVLKELGRALDETLRRLNTADHPVQKVPRINEVSSHFEEMLQTLLNETPGLNCEFPRTMAGRGQRSGYPDLRVVEKTSGRVYYLDPKLYAAGSRESSFRTFYFQPRAASGKVREDAVHLVVGIEHESEERKGWRFTGWTLVDLAHFKVQLKAEFQGSNEDLYRPEAILGTGKP